MKTRISKEQTAVVIVAIIGSMLLMVGFVEPLVLPYAHAQKNRIHHTSCSVNNQPVDCGGP